MNAKTETLTGGLVNGRLTLVLKTVRTRGWDERDRKPRVFVSGDALEPTWSHPPFGSARHDGSAEDKAWKKFNREEVRLQKEALKVAGLTGSFSRTAGCSCGCSPGFTVTEGLPRRTDAWLRANFLEF